MHRHSLTMTILSASLLWAQIPIVAVAISPDDANTYSERTTKVRQTHSSTPRTHSQLVAEAAAGEEQRLWSGALRTAGSDQNSALDTLLSDSSQTSLPPQVQPQSAPLAIAAKHVTPPPMIPPPPPELTDFRTRSSAQTEELWTTETGQITPVTPEPRAEDRSTSETEPIRIQPQVLGEREDLMTRLGRSIDPKTLLAQAAPATNRSSTGTAKGGRKWKNLVVPPPPPGTSPGITPMGVPPIPLGGAPTVTPARPPAKDSTAPGVRTDSPPPMMDDPAVGMPFPDEQDRFTGLARDYKLGPDDYITVIDPALGTPEQPSTSILKVGPDGNVVIYPVGVVKAAGRSIPQLNAVVNELAKQYEDNPHISIALARERRVTVYVLGDVVSPGLWSNGLQSAAEKEKDINFKMNQLQPIVSASGASIPTFTAFGTQSVNAGQVAPTPILPPDTEPTPDKNNTVGTPLTALAAIQLAGGIKETADIRHVLVRRRSSRKEFQVDLWKLLAEGDFEQDVLLQSGDVVYVPSGGAPFNSEKLGLAANQYKYVRVWGEVRTPGLYILKPGDDMFSILARAGGFTAVADTSKVEISRPNRNGTITSRWVNMQAALRGNDRLGRERIASGDVIIARASLTKKYGPSFANKVALAGGAILLLYLSRNIVDHSVNSSSTTVTRLGF